MEGLGDIIIMPSAKVLKSAQYIELGSYQYWPVLVPRGIRLYTYEQVPGFLRENPYITDGYRAYLTSRLCIKSLFILSNETVCMLCSVGYHLFCCHRSEKTSRRWMALDYAGISIGIICCYVPGVFYAFYCNNYWRQVYLVTVLAMMLAVFFAQIHPHYLTKKWQKLRSLIFCAVAGYGLIPTFHWIWLSGGFSSDIVQLNYLGFSHQVWHILVVLMFYWWHQSALFITNYRHSYPYPDYPLHS
ncbi:hypothetical protein cypCar_00002392 [Cyprinus carpio]|nr:hypothetical protein cypCar_00002392 [Cyprinus carpio]